MNLYPILLKVQAGRESEATLVLLILFGIVAGLIVMTKNSFKSADRHPVRAGCSIYFGIPAIIILILLLASLFIAAFSK